MKKIKIAIFVLVVAFLSSCTPVFWNAVGNTLDNINYLASPYSYPYPRTYYFQSRSRYHISPRSYEQRDSRFNNSRHNHR